MPISQSVLISGHVLKQRRNTHNPDIDGREQSYMVPVSLKTKQKTHVGSATGMSDYAPLLQYVNVELKKAIYEYSAAILCIPNAGDYLVIQQR